MEYQTMVDFSPVTNKEMKLLQFSEQFSLDDLRNAANESIDSMLELIKDMDDAAITFDPQDEGANDPYAVEGEENIGWSIAHLIAHVTASSEEGAAFSSLLARGVEAEERPRYETPWKDITTKAQCVQRLQESRRMRLAYLDTWPDTPFLDVQRKVSEGFVEYFGNINATASFLFGLYHEVNHYEQMKDVAAQIKATE
jgi:hypothetical protein